MFNTLDTAATAEILDALGESATYTPVTGSVETVDVIVSQNMELYLSDGSVSGKNTLINVAVPDTAIEQGSTFKVGTVTYTVREVLEHDATVVTCLVV